MAQLEYGYKTPGGHPGLIFDIAPYEINSLLIEEEVDGKIKFGMGVVAGEIAGKTIKLPTANTDIFEGAVVTNVHELDMKGNVVLEKGTSCSVMRYGRMWVRVDEDVEIKPNEKVFLITSGEKAGLFTNASGLEVPGKFIGASENGIAPVVLADSAMAAQASGDNGGDNTGDNTGDNGGDDTGDNTGDGN